MSPQKKTPRSYHFLGFAGAVLALLAAGYVAPEERWSAPSPGAVAAVPASPANAAAAQAATEHPRGLPPRDDRFFVIGSAECRTCHRGIYIDWAARPHAGATDLLDQDQRFDPACQPCHEPAFDDFQRGVGCESCHGPGSEYADLDVMVDPLKSTAAGMWKAAETCTYCHNPGHPFHVERDLAAEAASIHAKAIRR